jgi:hypothetical protein
MIHPVPGESILHNLSATLLKHGNTAESLGTHGIARIAQHQKLDPNELTRELVRQAMLNGEGYSEGADK